MLAEPSCSEHLRQKCQGSEFSEAWSPERQNQHCICGRQSGARIQTQPLWPPFTTWQGKHSTAKYSHTISLRSRLSVCFAETKPWMARCPKLSIFYNLKSSVQFSHSVMSDSLWPHGLQHTRLPCSSPTPRAYSNSCPSNQWYHPTISSSIIPFSSCLQSFPASGSFPMSQFFTSGGQSIGASASASVLPMNIQDWFPLGFTGLITLQSTGISRVFSSTTVQKHQFFGTQLSL